MSNVMSITGEGPIETLTDQYYFVFKFIDGEVKAWRGDYIAHDTQYAPNMIILSGPEATQVPVAAVNAAQIKYASYYPANQVTEKDGEIEFTEIDYVGMEKILQEEEGYV